MSVSAPARAYAQRLLTELGFPEPTAPELWQRVRAATPRTQNAATRAATTNAACNNVAARAMCEDGACNNVADRAMYEDASCNNFASRAESENVNHNNAVTRTMCEDVAHNNVADRAMRENAAHNNFAARAMCENAAHNNFTARAMCEDASCNNFAPCAESENVNRNNTVTRTNNNAADRAVCEDAVGAAAAACAADDDADAAAAFDWARSGVLPLVGCADGPPVLPSAPLATVASGAALALSAFASAHAGLDGARLLGERAALEPGLARRGRSSASGAARLLRARDGFVAVNLPRGVEDFRLLPAWLECAFPQAAAARDEESAREEMWDALARALARRPAHEVVARARLLGLPVAPCSQARVPVAVRASSSAPSTKTRALSSAPSTRARAPSAVPSTKTRVPSALSASTNARASAAVPSTKTRATPSAQWLVVTRAGARGRAAAVPRVLDLSALWAGPLAGQLLAHSGARVVKVECARRPDAARRGNPALFALLNGAKEQRAFDFTTPAGRRELAREFRAADVVLEASRPRALAQLGFDAHAWLAARAGRVWCGLSGYGRRAPGAAWVALGDDAAAAAGLCYEVAGAPLFVGDALADPLAGVHAALAVHAALRRGGGELLDLRLAGVVAHAIAQRAFVCARGRVVARAASAGFEVESGGRRAPVEAPRARQHGGGGADGVGVADARKRGARQHGGVGVSGVADARTRVAHTTRGGAGASNAAR